MQRRDSGRPMGHSSLGLSLLGRRREAPDGPPWAVVAVAEALACTAPELAALAAAAAERAQARPRHTLTVSRATPALLKDVFAALALAGHAPPGPADAAPAADRHLVFGFGSLVNPCSRLRTVPSAHLGMPALLSGWRRAWNYRCRDTYTAVGIVPDPNGIVSGVLIPLAADSDLAALDEREKDYDRVELPRASLALLLDDPRGAPPPDPRVRIWAYAAKREDPPDGGAPLAQSYIDSVVQGALSTLGAPFARLFLRTTGGWTGTGGEVHWVDDRGMKRGARYAGWEVDRVDAAAIDAMLAEEVGGEVLAARRRDPGFLGPAEVGPPPGDGVDEFAELEEVDGNAEFDGNMSAEESGEEGESEGEPDK